MRTRIEHFPATNPNPVLSVENDGTVRNSDKNIIQFSYGDDGIDPMHTDHSDAVNLDVLLLKAKSLDVSEIKEAVEIENKEKTKKEKKKRAAPEPIEKKVKAAPEESLSEEEIMKLFEEETGKNAEWRGKITKGYIEWKEERFGS